MHMCTLRRIIVREKGLMPTWFCSTMLFVAEMLTENKGE